ncbi:MAG: hypothetical protein AB7T49_18080 [Oligoflexales bacterium]
MRNIGAMIVCLLFCSQAFARSLEGIYEVPVRDQTLKKYASFKVRVDDYEGRCQPTHFTFTLPEALVGRTNQQIKVVRTEAGWSSDMADEVRCKQTGRFFGCSFVFSDIRVDLEGVHAHLDARPELTTADKTGMASVARHFDGEPIGTVSYKLRGSCG